MANERARMAESADVQADADMPRSVTDEDACADTGPFGSKFACTEPESHKGDHRFEGDGQSASWVKE